MNLNLAKIGGKPLSTWINGVLDSAESTISKAKADAAEAEVTASNAALCRFDAFHEIGAKIVEKEPKASKDDIAKFVREIGAKRGMTAPRASEFAIVACNPAVWERTKVALDAVRSKSNSGKRPRGGWAAVALTALRKECNPAKDASPVPVSEQSMQQLVSEKMSPADKSETDIIKSERATLARLLKRMAQHFTGTGDIWAYADKTLQPKTAPADESKPAASTAPAKGASKKGKTEEQVPAKETKEVSSPVDLSALLDGLSTTDRQNFVMQLLAKK